MNKEDLKIGDVISLVYGGAAIVKEICEDIRGYDDYVVKDDNGHIIRPKDITGVIDPNAVGGYSRELLEKQGYQVYNLWHIEDVTGNYNCTDDEAMEVLIAALTNESVMQQIWHAINFHAEENGLKQKQKEDV